MRVSEFGKLEVRPRDFWGSVGAVTLLLGAMGVYLIQTGKLPLAPPFSHWLWAGLLLFIWGSALFGFLRYGRRAFPLWRVAGILGYSLFVGSHFVPRLGRVASWMDGVGSLLMMGGILWPYLEFGKRRPSSPPADAPTHETP